MHKESESNASDSQEDGMPITQCSIILIYNVMIFLYIG